MWCSVQECRGPLGERLKRSQWSEPVEGELKIGLADIGWVASLDRDSGDGRRYQLLFPLSDVRVQTLEDGILVIGFAINATERPVREVRQAWFCRPVPRTAPSA